MAGERGECTESLIELYRDLSKGGAGLLITGHIFVSEEGRATPHQLGLYDESLTPGYCSLTEAVHQYGGKIFAQLAHAGIYAHPARPELPLLAATAGAAEPEKNQKECTEDDLATLIAAFKEAAQRALQTGFDGVQLHAAHGYLLSQFLSPRYNKRGDSYGGSVENRSRLIRLIVRSMRESLGQRFPILVKMNCSDFNVPGLELHDSVEVAMLLEHEGIDGVEISGGLLTSRRRGPTRTGVDTMEKEAFFRDESTLFKKSLDIPLILVGGIRSYETAEVLIESGICDFVALCRPFISEPDIVNRWKSGDLKKSRCYSDNLCFRPIFNGEGVRCVTFSKHDRE
jgi:2,4-dienoyl-CoA reductase-like NADH-dependent reductase (Old Yellow Enzyme family)